MNFRVKFNEENANFRVKFGEVQTAYGDGENVAVILNELITRIEALERRVEALENGGGSSTNSVLGTATLNNLRLA